ncbi:hypothetical protein [Sphingomonas sp.]|uniref:hypothetical protein n=1 Tax=Sphingomonas sp. TaxID=28214 RepID=UPI000DB37906|nr:hypothetical protein [Sphingomonas sp.]PZU06763.1 MAG: hypothetical protein DI605_18260 [Sphingomonas sp.]
MIHLILSRKPWFAAKRFGIGAGRPISIEGWVTIVAFLALIAGLTTAQARGTITHIQFVAFVAIAMALLLAIVARHTEGGWRWRWGK